MPNVRMDKWLWAARFFKTRALAARACELGRIQSGSQSGAQSAVQSNSRANAQSICKPAREVRVGDMLRITNEGGDFEVEVLVLSEARGPASVAQTLYRETDASRELRMKVAAERKAMRQWEQLPATRPNKRDRRRIIQFRSGRSGE
jgi:ribosome-associated heat shock protein Hsp15